MAGSEALTRFANNRIHQNVAVDDAVVHVRTVVGKRQGGASTNRLDDASIAAACHAAYEAAVHAPEDPTFEGLPEPEPWEAAQRARESAREFGPERRARAVRDLIAASVEAPSVPLTAAGKVEVSDGRRRDRQLARSRRVGGDHGVRGHRPVDVALAAAAGGPRSRARARRASTRRRWAGKRPTSRCAEPMPQALEPGEYTVVLGPEAVGEMLTMLAYTGLSAKALAEGRSFLDGKIGERIMSESVTIVDDALSPDATGLTFDFEGMPKKRVEFVADGIARGVVTDSYWARPARRCPTPATRCPRPTRSAPTRWTWGWRPGDATLDELIGSVASGRLRDAVLVRERRRPDDGRADRHDPRRHVPHRGRAPDHAPSRTFASRRAPSTPWPA